MIHVQRPGTISPCLQWTSASQTLGIKITLRDAASSKSGGILTASWSMLCVDSCRLWGVGGLKWFYTEQPVCSWISVWAVCLCLSVIVLVLIYIWSSCCSVKAGWEFNSDNATMTHSLHHTGCLCTQQVISWMYICCAHYDHRSCRLETTDLEEIVFVLKWFLDLRHKSKFKSFWNCRTMINK